MHDSAIEVFPEPNIEGPIAYVDRVLQVERKLLDIRTAAEGKQRGLRTGASILRLRRPCQHRSGEVKATQRRDKGRNSSPSICAIVWLKRTRAVA